MKTTKLKNDQPVIFHFRKSDSTVVLPGDKLERSGVTVVYDPQVQAYGVAFCGENDNFCRQRGIKIALGRRSIPANHPPKTIEAVKKEAIKLARKEIIRYVDYRLEKLDKQEEKIRSQREQLLAIKEKNRK